MLHKFHAGIIGEDVDPVLGCLQFRSIEFSGCGDDRVYIVRGYEGRRRHRVRETRSSRTYLLYQFGYFFRAPGRSVC